MTTIYSTSTNLFTRTTVVFDVVRILGNHERRDLVVNASRFEVVGVLGVVGGPHLVVARAFGAVKHHDLGLWEVVPLHGAGKVVKARNLDALLGSDHLRGELSSGKVVAVIESDFSFPSRHDSGRKCNKSRGGKSKRLHVFWLLLWCGGSFENEKRNECALLC